MPISALLEVDANDFASAMADDLVVFIFQLPAMKGLRIGFVGRGRWKPAGNRRSPPILLQQSTITNHNQPSTRRHGRTVGWRRRSAAAQGDYAILVDDSAECGGVFIGCHVRTDGREVFP